MVDSTHETATGLRARLMEAAAAIDEEEPKEEPKGEKEKESGETKENEPTPNVMLLDSFLPGKQHVPYSLPTQMAHYARVKLNKYNEVAYPDGPILKSHKPESLNCLCPGEDPLEHIMDNAVKLDTLHKLKKSLKKVFNRMSLEGKQDDLTWPNVFNHILESVVTDRIRYLYRKHEKSLLEVFGTPFGSDGSCSQPDPVGQ